MRSIEKGLLLAEYFSVDTYPYVANFVDWIKSQDQYKLFLERKETIGKRKGWQAYRLNYYFDSIKLNDIRTIEDGMVVYGQMNYLIRSSLPTYYSNPFLIEYLEDRHMKVGDFIITFDGKRMSLNEFSELTNYSFNKKKEAFNKLFYYWEKEMFYRIKDPLDEIKRNEMYFPNKKTFSPYRILEISTYSLEIVLFILMIVLPIDSFKFFITDTSNNMYARMTFSIAISFLVIGIIILVSSILYSHHISKDYIKARKKTFVELKKDQNEVADSLKKYILESISNKKRMDKEIKEYTRVSEHFQYLDYFTKMVQRKQFARDTTFFVIEKISYALAIISLLGLIILIFLKGVGSL